MYKSLALIPIILLGCCLGASAQVYTFNYTGGPQSFVVPAGVSTVYVTAYGADGGQDYIGAAITNLGGNGALVSCQLSVVGGELLNLYVGGKGLSPVFSLAGAAGGYNGGGKGTGDGGGGGGSSDIRVGGVAVSDRVIVAGGGGGAGLDCIPCGNFEGNAGHGGGLTGEDGFIAGSLENAPHDGASQIYGFAQPTGADGSVSYGSGGVGGGGGGFWGAYGGYDIFSGSSTGYGGGGGGGGSSYTDPGTVSNVFHGRGGNVFAYPADGQIQICVPAKAGKIIGSQICVGGGCTTFSDTGNTVAGAWSSSNPAYATVNPVTGLVCPVAFGLDTIFYICSTPCGNDTAMYIFNVAQAPVAITGHDTMCKGNTVTLSDTSDGGLGTWKATPALIASVSGGVVTGNNPGTATITYTIPGGCSVYDTVTVTAPLPPITGPTSVCVGVDSIILSDATGGGTWVSASTSVAIIPDSTKGDVFGVGTGNTYIYYYFGGCYTTTIIASNDTPSAITGTDFICQGDATALSEFSISGVWTSSNPAIATVNILGDVIGVAAGLDTIWYTVPGCPADSFPMTINPLPKPITGMTSICIGLATMVSDSTLGGAWSSSDTTVAIISPTTGVITPADTILGATAIITYTLPTACYVTFPVVVNAGPSPIFGPDSVCQGATTTISDLAPGGTWSSTVLAIAQVIDTSGVVSGISSGTVNISYTFPNGCYATEPFVVEPPVPAFVTVTKNPNTDSVCAGTPVIYTATPVNAGLNPSYSWVKFYTLIPLAGDTTVFADTAIHGDVIIVKLVVGTGVCALHDTVADTVTMDVYPNVTPIVTVTKLAAPDTITYLGEPITFFSSIKYGGAGPTYQWYISGAPVPGATNSVYTTNVYGTEAVYCVVTGNSRCDNILRTDTSNVIFIFDQLSTTNVPYAHSNLSLFPNPNNGTLTLSGNVAGNNEFSIEVSDMLGQVVYRSKATPQNGSLHEQISLDNALPNGSYLMHVSSGTDNQVFHFVVTR